MTTSQAKSPSAPEAIEDQLSSGGSRRPLSLFRVTLQLRGTSAKCRDGSGDVPATRERALARPAPQRQHLGGSHWGEHGGTSRPEWATPAAQWPCYQPFRRAIERAPIQQDGGSFVVLWSLPDYLATNGLRALREPLAEIHTAPFSLPGILMPSPTSPVTVPATLSAVGLDEAPLT